MSTNWRNSILPGRGLAPPVLDTEVHLAKVLLAHPVPVPNDNLDRRSDSPLPHLRLELGLASTSLNPLASRSPNRVQALLHRRARNPLVRIPHDEERVTQSITVLGDEVPPCEDAYDESRERWLRGVEWG